MRLALAFLLASAATAHADQCQLLDPATASRAADELRLHPHYIIYCPPCGEKAPGSPAEASEIGTLQGTVTIDGSFIDLAYTYVQVSDTAYANLAMRVGCPTQDVPPSLRIDPATASGVIIRSSDEPVPADPVEPAPPPPQAAIADPAIVYVVHEAGEPAWLIALLAAAATSGAWAAIAVVRRRRRAFEPRAFRL